MNGQNKWDWQMYLLRLRSEKDCYFAFFREENTKDACEKPRNCA